MHRRLDRWLDRFDLALAWAGYIALVLIACAAIWDLTHGGH